MSEVIDISPSNLDSSLCLIQPSVSHDVFCIEIKQAGWQYTALMYSFPYLEPVCCSMSSPNCCFLTCIHISQDTGQVVWYSHLSQNFPQFAVIHTVKGFGIVNKVEVDVFLELSWFFQWYNGCWQFDLGSSTFSKTSLNIWKFMVHVLLKPGLESIEYYFTSMWDECNCAVVWALFGIAFLWDWNENWPFLPPGLLQYFIEKS